LRTHEPVALDVENERAKDVWEPLLVIADIAGADWPQRARTAGKELSGEVEEEEEEFTVRLLSDIRELFLTEFPDGSLAQRAEEAGRPDDGPRLASADIVKKLLSLEDRPYSALGKMQKPLTQHGLGRTLRDFKIRSGSVRPINETKTAKGYYQHQFEDVFSRYLPALKKTSKSSHSPIPPSSNRHKGTNQAKPGENEDSEPAQTDNLLRFENAVNPSNPRICAAVPVQSAGSREAEENDGVFEDEICWRETLHIIVHARREGVALSARADGKLGWKADRRPSAGLLIILKKHKAEIIALIRPPSRISTTVGAARVMLRRLRALGFEVALNDAFALLISDGTGRRRDVAWRLPIGEVFDTIVAGLADDPDLLDFDIATTEPSDLDLRPDLSEPELFEPGPPADEPPRENPGSTWAISP
jgi:hypothetical protein